MQEFGLILAAGLAAVHGFISKLNVLNLIPRKHWISFAGGVSIGYVFLDIFPELSKAQAEVERSAVPWIAYIENRVYLMALCGLLVFYGLDVMAIASRQHNRHQSQNDCTTPAIFWVHIGVFAALNAIFGYLAQHFRDRSPWQGVLFFIAIALHFFVVDFHLREHHKVPYDRYGRWLLTAAILVGAIAGQALHLNEAALSLVWSFLAGSIILHILKHELPDERQSCFRSFVGGAVLYAGLILLV